MSHLFLKKKFILGSIVFSLFSAPTLYATQSKDYQPELDTKQIQPHTTDEISNGPKAEGAKAQPTQNGSAKPEGMNNTTSTTTQDTHTEGTRKKGAEDNPHADERGSIKANQASPEFKEDKAKCEALVGQSQNECLVDLQKKYNLPN